MKTKYKLEFKDPVVSENGMLTKSLYINGTKTKAEFVQRKKMLESEDDNWLFSRIKHCRVNDLPPFTSISFYGVEKMKEFKTMLHYGNMDSVMIARYDAEYEVCISPIFDHKAARTTPVNPLRMIRESVALAKSSGFTKTQYLGGNRFDDEWFHLYSAYFYRTGSFKNETILQKIEEAAALLNKLQDKLADKLYAELSIARAANRLT
jgi:hypothetical protein